MGWIGKIILVIIVLGALAILADIITWIYEVAWITSIPQTAKSFCVKV